jgi:gas vesicle protein
MTNGGSTWTYFGVALAGGVVGALAGLLLAPAPGRDTRRRLSEEAEDLARQGQRVIEGVADYVVETFQDGRRTLRRVANG